MLCPAAFGRPPMDLPGIGRLAVVHDPQIAAFTVAKLDNPDD